LAQYRFHPRVQTLASFKALSLWSRYFLSGCTFARAPPAFSIEIVGGIVGIIAVVDKSRTPHR
jgi:hypothetical protein